MTNEVVIGRRTIGPDHPVFVVAELSANHNGNYQTAVELVHAASRAGADAVKLQTYTPDTMTLKSDAECFQIKSGTLWDGRTLYDLYEEAAMPWEWQPRLLQVAQGLGLECFSTPYDSTSVDFLAEMGVPAYKIASFEIIDIPLLQVVAATGKPIILSTGMATLHEIEEALMTLADAGATDIVLLKATSAYPAPPEEMNLLGLAELQRRFDCPVGLSDHTMGSAVASAAVALGACFIEKHLTLSRQLPGPDSKFSMQPEEFKQLVDSVHVARKALGSIRFGPGNHERASMPYRRSLFVVKTIKRGEIFSQKNLRSIRPANGLHPKHLKEVLGHRATRDLAPGTPLERDHVEAF